MRILQINSVCGVTGTGHIVADLYDAAVARGHECMIAYGEHKYQNDPGSMSVIEIGCLLDCQKHALLTRLWDMQGFGSRKATQRFLRIVDDYQPDVIHLHNLHGYYMNIELLFDYVKKRKIRVIWTLHDCWPFTGHCVHFQNVGCEKWKEGCHDCPQTRQYPSSLWMDRSTKNYLEKKEIFTGVEDMTLLVPSRWMEERVRQSFLQDYKIQVVYNGIDLSVYKPEHSNFRQKYGLEGQYIVLGVANVWVERKGLGIFLELAKMLGEEYSIVLVGLSAEQIAQMPPGVLGLPRTDNPLQLAQIYTAADVFVNPSREETFGLTVAEAMACGTWPIVYADTACAEVVKQGCGQSVQGDLQELKEAIQAARRNRGTMENIEEFAQFFSKERFGEEILAIYEGQGKRKNEGICVYGCL